MANGNTTAFYFLKGLEGIIQGIRQKKLMEMQREQIEQQAKSQREGKFIDLFTDPRFTSALTPESQQQIAGYLQERGAPPISFAQPEEPSVAEQGIKMFEGLPAESKNALLKQFGVIEGQEEDMVEPTPRMRKYGYTKPMPLKDFITAQNNILDYEKQSGAGTQPKEKVSPELQLVEDELEFISDQIFRMSTSQYDFSDEVEQLQKKRRKLQRALLKLKKGEELTEQERAELFNKQQRKPQISKADVISEVARLMPGYRRYLEKQGSKPEPQVAGQGKKKIPGF